LPAVSAVFQCLLPLPLDQKVIIKITENRLTIK
jgi:hypothetical protein